MSSLSFLDEKIGSKRWWIAQGYKWNWISGYIFSTQTSASLGSFCYITTGGIILITLWSCPYSFQFSSIQSCLTLCNPMDCSMPGFPVHHQLSELVQTHVHGVGDAIQPSDPLASPCPPAFNLSQHLFQWVRSLHQVTKVLEFQLQHPSVLPMNIQDWFLLGLTVLPNKNNCFISDLQSCARI